MHKYNNYDNKKVIVTDNAGVHYYDAVFSDITYTENLKPINMNDQYKTFNGLHARIICIDASEDWPVISIINGEPHKHDKYGRNVNFNLNLVLSI